MKNNKTVIVAIAALAIIGIISGTYAYFTSTATVSNTFTANTYETLVERSLENLEGLQPGDTVNIQNLKVTNNGQTTISVRAKVEESLSTSAALNLDGKSIGETGYDASKDIMVKTFSSNWERNATDGYYYYKGTVAANSSTDTLISSLVFNANTPNNSSCEYVDESSEKHYSVTSGEPAVTTLDGAHQGNVVCRSDANGYAGATYTLKITFDTIQSTAVASQWTNAPASAQATAQTINK